MSVLEVSIAFFQYAAFRCKEGEKETNKQQIAILRQRPSNDEGVGKILDGTIYVFAKLSPGFSSAGLSLALMLISPNPPPVRESTET